MNPFKIALRKARSARHLFLLRVRPPAQRRHLARLFALTRPRRLARSEQARRQAQAIRQEGFLLLGKPFDEAKLRRIRDALAQRDCFDAWRPELGTFPLAEAPADANNVHVVEPETLQEVVEIANDPDVLAIVSDYLGCRPTIDDVLAWWSLPGRPAPREEQFFHRDNDSIRFVKLFIYLSDVDEDSGPHVFVRGSHRTNDLLQLARRYSDEEVEAAGIAGDMVKITGPFGTTLLEDTYGLHKGALPKDKLRLMLQVRYTMIPSIFAQKGAKKADVRGFDRYTNRLIAAPEGIAEPASLS